MSSIGISGERSRLPDARQLADRLRVPASALLFGLRLWAGVCLALYLSFWLQLENPSWAGASAAIVSQPHLGAALRKGWFRLIGTVIGAVAIVVLAACFPQQRVGFLVGLALWGAGCAFMATLLRNFASYSAALAGYTAAIVASDLLGATGGANGQVFVLAVSRASEICVGIVCAGLVMAMTDFGDAPSRLAKEMAALATQILAQLVATLSGRGEAPAESRRIGFGLAQRIGALDVVMDEASGESYEVRYHLPQLEAASTALLRALLAWRRVAVHLDLLPGEQGRREIGLIAGSLPSELKAQVSGAAIISKTDPIRLGVSCMAAVRELLAIPRSTPSVKLVADEAARSLLALRRALGGLLVLTGHAQPVRAPRRERAPVPDYAPSFLNAARAFVAIGAVELFWVVTAWPNGAFAVAFAAIALTLFSARPDQAYATTMLFMVGAAITTVLAAIADFALLPQMTSFAGLCLVIGLVLVPAGVLMTRPWLPPVSIALTATFIPLLGPANQMNYNTLAFYNVALAIFVGLGAAALAFRMVPPLSAELRVRRLLGRTLRDLRRLARDRLQLTSQAWEERIYSYLQALPEKTEPMARSDLLSALVVGNAIIRLRPVAGRFDLDREFSVALDAVAQACPAAAIERLVDFDAKLAAVARATPGLRIRERARGNILVLSETLAQHKTYFESPP
ncbi:FUSC family protein [Bradyrhizobium sp. BRP22]|uniref:FUSC family protein n=1 Tax=Bradyrhizobium sp. BRP22 TaxID=2793821 RepID=UPI001CD4BE11|nr:FUSC family protein [Bradyrhizobium sp. BRP22]MCA1452582.1 FUSC family protein [Bradyrhizobium sp. BRP22]